MLTMRLGKRVIRRPQPGDWRRAWGWKRYALTAAFSGALIGVGLVGIEGEKVPALTIIGLLILCTIFQEMTRKRLIFGAGCSVKRQAFDMKLAVIKGELFLESVNVDRPSLEVARFHSDQLDAMPCPLCSSYGWRRGKSGHFICLGDD